jgi:hypothetical protein
VSAAAYVFTPWGRALVLDIAFEYRHWIIHRNGILSILRKVAVKLNVPRRANERHRRN